MSHDFWEKVLLSIIDKGLLAIGAIIVSYFVARALERYKRVQATSLEIAKGRSTAILELLRALGMADGISRRVFEARRNLIATKDKPEEREEALAEVEEVTGLLRSTSDALRDLRHRGTLLVGGELDEITLEWLKMLNSIMEAAWSDEVPSELPELVRQRRTYLRERVQELLPPVPLGNESSALFELWSSVNDWLTRDTAFAKASRREKKQFL